MGGWDGLETLQLRGDNDREWKRALIEREELDLSAISFSFVSNKKDIKLTV